MRLVAFAIMLALAGCPGDLQRDALEDDSGSGSEGASPGECRVSADCAPAGAKCCDCPTHAIPTTDPAYRACSAVDCPTLQCGSPMQAECNLGQCVLVCSPVECPQASCTDGFQTDDNGCLICDCALGSAAGECAFDTDCVRVRADCCGCPLGGEDTAVPMAQVTAYEAQLNCPPNPSCPGVDTCSADLAPRCVQGTCALVSGALPPNACGRADLPPCPPGDVCVINASDPATMLGVGVCQPASP